MSDAGFHEFDLTLVPTDGTDPLRFKSAQRFRRGADTFRVEWSPDSRSLLSRYDEAMDVDFRRHLILGLDGTRAGLLVGGSLRWLHDSTLLVYEGQRAFIYERDGALRRELDVDGLAVSRGLLSSNQLLMIVPSREEWPSWYLVDLTSDRRTPIRLPFDDEKLRAGPGERPGWHLASFSGRYAAFSWSGPALQSAPEGPFLYMYDARDRSGRPVSGFPIGPTFGVHDRVRPSISWSGDQSRFTASWSQRPPDFYNTGVYIVEADEMLARPLPGIVGLHIAWSPDGSEMLVRNQIRDLPEFDPQGIANFGAGNSSGGDGWGRSEYYVVSADDRRVLHTFRASGHACELVHSGSWSPDGRWLALGARVTPCTLGH